MAGTVSYPVSGGSGRSPVITGSSISAASDFNSVGLFASNVASPGYSTDAVYSQQTAATSEANAISQNRYTEIVVDVNTPQVLSTLAFKAARGGASTPRGASIRTSADGYATTILGGALSTVRPTWTQFSGNPNISVSSSITLRVYFWGPSNAVIIDIDELTLTFTDPGGGSVSLTVPDFSTGSPDIGVPVANYIRNLSISNFNVGSPSYGPVSWTQRHALIANGLSTSSPTLGTPTLGQRHALSIAAFAVGSPGIGTPSLSTAGTANFTINGLTTGSPTFGNVGLGQRHVLTIPSFSSGPPTTGTPALGQRHALTSSGLTVGPPDLGTPALSLAAIPVKSILAADAEERVLEPEMEIRRLSADVELRVLQYEEDI